MPALDTGGRAYEVGLEIRRDGLPFGAVGPGCAYFLGRVAERLRAAREADLTAWPDPDGRLPQGPLFAFRQEGRRAGPGGELSCEVRDSPQWVPWADGQGRGDWRVVRRAVVEAWDGAGRGVRAVLTSAELTEFVGTVLAEAGHAGLEPMPSGADRTNLETSCN
ncbi:hypothetical protein [Actinocorallia sp. A-T 12471]|uniref:hypothetical protein n=1 Tax=Actinocorallia sp. A-T 12471 TaxID=3089813 RepID=UPI0029CAE704|nr:hypothetical protein [Actinocorallia sp. A-T 12471]MDX6738581.1 hypothetical protein [Actinocorallia sp. A-T 12471]